MLENIIIRFLKYSKSFRNLSDSSIDNYRLYLRRFRQYILASGGEDSVDSVTIDILVEFIDALKSTPVSTSSRYYKYGGNMSPNTVRYHIITIKRFINRCNSEGLTKVDARDVPLPKIVKREIPHLEHTDLRRLIELPEIVERNELIALRNKTMILIGYYCGLRMQETLDLRADLVMQTKPFNITGKGAQDRRICMTQEIVDSMKLFYEKRVAQGIDSKRAFVCLDRVKKGRKFGHEGTGLFIKKYRKILGLSPLFTYHGLRHSFGTHLYEELKDLYAVGALMGHKSPKSTEGYIKLNNNMLGLAQASLNLANRN